MLKKAFIKEAPRESHSKFAYVTSDKQDLEVIQHKESRVTLAIKRGEVYLVTEAGISKFAYVSPAVKTFLNLCAMAEEVKPVRKATIAHFQKDTADKTASFIKLADSYMGDDPWIGSSDELIHTSSSELWAMTSDKSYIARLFDPNILIKD